MANQFSRYGSNNFDCFYRLLERDEEKLFNAVLAGRAIHDAGNLTIENYSYLIASGVHFDAFEIITCETDLSARNALE